MDREFLGTKRNGLTTNGKRGNNFTVCQARQGHSDYMNPYRSQFHLQYSGVVINKYCNNSFSQHAEVVSQFVQVFSFGIR
jgi:hypothetical protein